MTIKFLEELQGETKDLKEIKKTLNKIYKIEVKAEKRESREAKREKQSKKRKSGDIKSILGITKQDEKKSKKGILSLFGGVLKGILAIGAKPLLMMAGIGIVGGAITAYIKSGNFRKAVNEKILVPLRDSIIKSAPEMLMAAIKNTKFIARQPPEIPRNLPNKPPKTNTNKPPKTNTNKPPAPSTQPAPTRTPKPVAPKSPKPSPILGPNGKPLPPRVQGTTPARAPSIPKPKAPPKISPPKGSLPKGLLNPKTLKSLGLGYLLESGLNTFIGDPLEQRMLELVKNKVDKMSPEDKEKYFTRKMEEYKKEKEYQNHWWHTIDKITAVGDRTQSERKTDTIEKILYSFGLQVQEEKEEPQKLQTGGSVTRMNGQTPKDLVKNRPGNGPISEDTIAQGMIPVLHRQKGGKVFLHWAASTYNGASPNYHATVQGSGKVVKTRDYNSFGGGHTYRQNNEGIGISLAAMSGATTENFGQYPVKRIQYENMAKLTAKILTSWGHNASYVNDKTVPTHAEAGRDFPGDNYGPKDWGGDGNKWDLWKLYQGDPNGSGGPKIRNMIKRNMANGNNIQLEEEDDTQTSQDRSVSLSPSQQSSVQKGISVATNPVEMMKNLGSALSGFGGKFGQFVGKALTATATTFGDAQKLQTGGFVGNHKKTYHGMKKRFPEAKPHHVVGAMANFETEAPGIKPNTYQTNGGPGRGIAQWEVPSAKNPTGRWATAEKKYGKDTINSLDKQLDFVKWEMNTGHPLPDGRPNLPWGRAAKSEWLSSKNSSEATDKFLKGYEAPSIPHMDRRLANAKKFNNMAAIEESKKSGSPDPNLGDRGPDPKTKPRKKLFGLFQNGGVVGASKKYALNNMNDEFQIVIPIEIPPQQNQVVLNTKQSMSRHNTGRSNGAGDIYRLATGAAYS